MEIILKTLAVGDLIVVDKFRNNTSGRNYVGVPLKIIQLGSNYYSCNLIENPNGYGNICVYFTNPQDDFYPLDRIKRTKFYEEQVRNSVKHLIDLKDKIEVLHKYPTDEDYQAHKLKMILDNKDDEQAIAKVLKELKGLKLI